MDGAVLFILRSRLLLYYAGSGVNRVHCGNRGSVGRVYVLRWCMRGVGRGLGTGSGRVGCCYVGVRCESG